MSEITDIRMLSDEQLEALARHIANYYMVDWVLDSDSNELLISYYDNSNVTEVMEGLSEYKFITPEANGKILVKGDSVKLDHLADRIDWHYE